MHFMSAPVAVKMPSKRVLFILCFDGHFGRGFGNTHQSRWYINILTLVVHCL